MCDMDVRLKNPFKQHEGETLRGARLKRLLFSVIINDGQKESSTKKFKSEVLYKDGVQSAIRTKIDSSSSS